MCCKNDVCPLHALSLSALEIMTVKSGNAGFTQKCYGDDGVAALCAIPWPHAPKETVSVPTGDLRKGKYHTVITGDSCWSQTVGGREECAP